MPPPGSDRTYIFGSNAMFSERRDLPMRSGNQITFWRHPLAVTPAPTPDGAELVAPVHAVIGQYADYVTEGDLDLDTQIDQDDLTHSMIVSMAQELSFRAAHAIDGMYTAAVRSNSAWEDKEEALAKQAEAEQHAWALIQLEYEPDYEFDRAW